MDIKTKLKNTMMGVAIGDATGVGVEFKSRELMPSIIDFTSYVNAHTPPFGEKLTPGTYSDDAEQSIAVLKAMSDKRPFTTDLLLEYFKAEYLNDAKEKGFTRHGHGSIEKWFQGKKTIEEVRAMQADREDPGNAPPMRAVPLGFLPSTIMNEYAIINSDATHPHPKGRAASIAIARATEYMVIKELDPQGVIKYARNFVSDKTTRNVLAQVDALGTPDTLNDAAYELLGGPQPLPFPPVKGWTIYGLACASMRTAATALYFVKHSKDAFTGLQHAINFGGDVDSLAADVTGILAGRYGLDSLPAFMKEQVEGRDKIDGLVNNYLNKTWN